MQRFPSMKVGLASILSCLAILLGLYTTTGTASAHSAIHPFINVVSSLQRSGNCVSFQLEGGDFTPNHHVDLFASAGGGASINPDRVRANGDGRFLVDVTACENLAFENCGNFINSTNFCGFNLPQQDFCGLNGFSGACPFIGSAMRALPGPECPLPPCFMPSGPGMGGSGGTGGPGGRGPGGPWSNQSPLGPHFPQVPQVPQGPLGSPGSQGPQGSPGPHNFMPHHDCFTNPGSPGCPGQQHNDCFRFPRPGCPFFHPPFRFHRVPLFNFCNFNRHGRFPFCFRFFPQRFTISILITAVDEHTGKRAHAGVSIGGSF